MWITHEKMIYPTKKSSQPNEGTELPKKSYLSTIHCGKRCGESSELVVSSSSIFFGTFLMVEKTNCKNVEKRDDDGKAFAFVQLGEAVNGNFYKFST